jgi:hypothetical protein
MEHQEVFFAVRQPGDNSTGIEWATIEPEAMA